MSCATQSRQVPPDLTMRVRAVIAREMGLPFDDVRSDVRLEHDLMVDAINRVSIAVEIELAFGITLPSGVEQTPVTVDDFVTLVRRYAF